MTNNFAHISALVVESRQNMRTQIRVMLDGIGIEAVQFAPSASTAIRKLKEVSLDLVLCAHNLGGGQDGQHLLEDLRSRAIITRDTLFFVLSDTPQQEQVIGSAELSPDGYLVKPFSTSVLHSRLIQALMRRRHFLPLYGAIREQRLEAAIEYCQRAEATHPRYRIDFMLERADLLLADGLPQDAHEVFAQVNTLAPCARASLGMARALAAEGKQEAARQMVEALLLEQPLFLAAYECLADLQEAAGELVEARQTLAKMIEISPNRLSRLRHFARLAMATDEPQAAEQALTQVVEQSRLSLLYDPQDQLRLLEVHLSLGRLPQAERVQAELDQRQFNEHPLAPVCRAISRSRLAESNKDEARAREASLQAFEHSQRPELAEEAKKAACQLAADTVSRLVGQCLQYELEDEACTIAAQRLRNADSDEARQAAHSLLRENGRSDLAEEIEARESDVVGKYVRRSDELGRSGDYAGATQVLIEASAALPGSVEILVHAGVASIRLLREQGWQEQIAQQALSGLMRARRMDPFNEQARQLLHYLHRLAVENKSDMDPLPQ